MEGKDLLALCRAGRKVEEIYYCPGSDLGTDDEKIGEFEELGIDVIKISKLAFSKASYRSAGQGLIGVVRSWELLLKPESMKGTDLSWYLMMWKSRGIWERFYVVLKHLGQRASYCRTHRLIFLIPMWFDHLVD